MCVYARECVCVASAHPPNTHTHTDQCSPLWFELVLQHNTSPSPAHARTPFFLHHINNQLRHNINNPGMRDKRRSKTAKLESNTFYALEITEWMTPQWFAFDKYLLLLLLAPLRHERSRTFAIARCCSVGRKGWRHSAQRQPPQSQRRKK